MSQFSIDNVTHLKNVLETSRTQWIEVADRTSDTVLHQIQGIWSWRKFALIDKSAQSTQKVKMIFTTLPFSDAEKEARRISKARPEERQIVGIHRQGADVDGYDYELLRLRLQESLDLSDENLDPGPQMTLEFQAEALPCVMDYCAKLMLEINKPAIDAALKQIDMDRVSMVSKNPQDANTIVAKLKEQFQSAMLNEALPVVPFTLVHRRQLDNNAETVEHFQTSAPIVDAMELVLHHCLQAKEQSYSELDLLHMDWNVDESILVETQQEIETHRSEVHGTGNNETVDVSMRTDHFEFSKPVESCSDMTPVF